jgi:competence protein ComEC
MTEQGRALSRSRGQGFAASRWAENDGTLLTQEDAAALWPDPAVLPEWGYSLKGRHAVVALPDGAWLIHVMGKAAHAAPIPCVPDIIVVSDRGDKLPLTGGCRVMDAVTLRKTGSLALLADGRWLTAREVAGDRAWTLRDQGE